MTAALELGDVERFRGIVASRFGLQFQDSRLAFLGEVLRKRLEACKCDCRLYLAELERDRRGEAETGTLAQELTVGETYFFRNIEQFHALSEVALPNRMRARGGARQLRLLSAACASGEEPYSIAIAVREAIADPSWQISIRAVDVNPAALRRARIGRYGEWALRETPPDVQARWFVREGRELALSSEVRAAVTFEERNLVLDDPDLWQPDSYDVVFCRNVLMYFSPEQMRAVVERIARSLAPGGYLFLGHAETLRGISQSFHLRDSHGTFYYERGEIEGERPLRVASIPAVPPAPCLALEQPMAWFDVIGQASERVRGLDQGAARDVAKAGAKGGSLAPALALLQQERFAEALAFIRAMPPEATRDPSVLLLTAVLLVQSRHIAAAEVANELLAIDEFNSAAHYVLALSHEGSGDDAEAARHAAIAAYLDPDFAMPRLRLGMLARRGGDRTTARRELGRALILLQREDASRLLLFGGGFTREGLIALCRAELKASEER